MLKKILLTGFILSGKLFATTLTSTTVLIEKMKTVSPDERFELMNQIKSNILSLNENDRVEAIRQMRETRQKRKEAKLNKFKAGLTPEQLAIFEEKLRIKKESRKAYKESMAKFREGLSDAQIKEMKNIKTKRTTRYTGKKRIGGKGKRINSKTHTTLTAEQLEKFKQK